MAHQIATWLLPIFFALVGTELRKEIREGAFKKRSDLLIPLSSAIFGVAIPFLIYQLFVHYIHVTNSGWGLVVATDLPLALFALKLFKSNGSTLIRPYLLSLAIFDDLISIILIALIYHQNGIHPTVYGFIFGLLFPLDKSKQIFKKLNWFSNYLILPIFILTTIWSDFSFQLGWLTLAVMVSRMAGKPIGVLIGNFLATRILKSSILTSKQVLAVGTIATLGLSVSLLFAQIASLSKIAIASALITIPVSLIHIKVLARTFLKEIG